MNPLTKISSSATGMDYHLDAPARRPEKMPAGTWEHSHGPWPSKRQICRAVPMQDLRTLLQSQCRTNCALLHAFGCFYFSSRLAPQPSSPSFPFPEAALDHGHTTNLPVLHTLLAQGWPWRSAQEQGQAAR